MSAPNILTDTTPALDEADPRLAHSVITDAWGLYFAQGGVVMAAALRAMSTVLDRDDLTLASASAVFCRPVACGPVQTRVTVLRNGRRGAQVQGQLSDAGAPDDAVSVAVTAVFTDPTLDGPTLSPTSRPVELEHAPAPSASPATSDNTFPLGFLDNTEWHLAAGGDVPTATEGPLPRIALWFKFNDAPAASGADWNPALLPIPGDALGSALVVAIGDGKPVGSVSLQIDLQVLAPISGEWIGIDTTCTHLGNGLAQGSLDLWSESGVHVATVTQTAMLRGLGE